MASEAKQLVLKFWLIFYPLCLLLLLTPSLLFFDPVGWEVARTTLPPHVPVGGHSAESPTEAENTWLLSPAWWRLYGDVPQVLAPQLSRWEAWRIRVRHGCLAACVPGTASQVRIKPAAVFHGPRHSIMPRWVKKYELSLLLPGSKFTHWRPQKSSSSLLMYFSTTKSRNNCVIIYKNLGGGGGRCLSNASVSVTAYSNQRNSVRNYYCLFFNGKQKSTGEQGHYRCKTRSMIMVYWEGNGLYTVEGNLPPMGEWEASTPATRQGSPLYWVGKEICEVKTANFLVNKRQKLSPVLPLLLRSDLSKPDTNSYSLYQSSKTSTQWASLGYFYPPMSFLRLWLNQIVCYDKNLACYWDLFWPPVTWVVAALTVIRKKNYFACSFWTIFYPSILGNYQES